MHESEQLRLGQIGLFLEASEGLRFEGGDVHGWVQSVLCRHEYRRQGKAALYHINAVDEVTQWQIMASVPRISEAYLLPILEAMLRQFPFRIQNFHTDNGSEYINASVSRLLNKLLIEQTKTRPRQSGDNGLVEARNGAVIRKHIGYGYIPAGHAELVNGFYRDFLNPCTGRAERDSVAPYRSALAAAIRKIALMPGVIMGKSFLQEELSLGLALLKARGTAAVQQVFGRRATMPQQQEQRRETRMPLGAE